ncbi:GntR family transcriptional regulator [Leifsonia naganoensis]|uniref:DNA-binding GntR family transcriptional regulator n=1 Tax=Leifsonia naganoensis TaxID=150025 RepID=A0A853DWE9_9MICO|nr:GntR family transcriptional regulator [Leifsonia naganoensis]NYK10580.1 DNA-binding GntR family transcriptional regulator [Leifsonia naganoensis]
METLDRSGLAGAAVGQLREAILEGRLVQGERLSEVSLSNTFGVSRAPIREALLHLEQEGLVVSLPYRGASVVTLSPQDFAELSTLRIALEKLAWTRASERASASDLDTLNEIIERMRDAVANDQKAKLVRLDLDFHEQIFLMADHSRLLAAWQAIKWQVALFLLTRRVKVDDYHRIIVSEHADLIHDLILNRDRDVEAAIEKHIDSGYGRLSASAVEASADPVADPAPAPQS